MRPGVGLLDTSDCIQLSTILITPFVDNEDCGGNTD